MAANGCSVGISKFYKKFLGHPPSWEFCCDEHDFAYDEGLFRYERKLADQRIRNCLLDQNKKIRGWVFYSFLRMFGWIWWYLIE